LATPEPLAALVSAAALIHHVDVKVAMRAGELMRSWRGGLPIHRFHDVLLVATAQVHGHCLLTKRDAVFDA
jgi:predicted nucleic acid-binding protein